MNAPGRQIWLDALRSGDYEQGKQELGDAKTGFCCLGLACKLAVDAGVIDEFSPEDYTLNGYPTVQKWIGLATDDGYYMLNEQNGCLTEANDQWATFAQIADIIETGVADA